MLLTYLPAGKLLTPHGVRGELKLEPWCEDAEFLRRFSTLYWDDAGASPVRVLSVRGQGRTAIVHLEGVEDRTAARALCGKVLYFARSDAHLPKGVWFYQDMIGCEVRDAATGQVYGTVLEVSHPGPQDIYTVRGKNGGEYRFPGVPEFLKEKNPEAGYLLVSPIPGMLDDDVYQNRPGKEEE